MLLLCKDILHHHIFPELSDLDIVRVGNLSQHYQRHAVTYFCKVTKSLWIRNATAAELRPWLSSLVGHALENITLKELKMDSVPLVLPCQSAKTLHISCTPANGSWTTSMIIELQEMGPQLNGRIALLQKGCHKLCRLEIKAEPYPTTIGPGGLWINGEYSESEGDFVEPEDPSEEPDEDYWIKLAVEEADLSSKKRKTLLQE